MKSIIKSLLVVVAVAAIAGGATYSYFSDTETSNGNTFTAGTLDLTLNGNNGVNTQLFNVSNLRPGNQPTSKYTIRNIGSVAGFIDMENISFVSTENELTEPESEAGDTTSDTGELDDVLNVRMYIDYNGNGSYNTGDNLFYSGLVSGLPTHFELNEPIPANSGIDYVTEVYDWWNTSMDNQAQSDSLVINSTFELGQTAAQ